MKLLIHILSIFLLTACGEGFNAGFSKGVKADTNTGLTASYNGFMFNDIYLADEKENKLPDNKIILGSKLAIVATGVDNFVEKNGKVFPGCTILLTDSKGQVILKIDDAFSDMTEGSLAKETKVLKASLNTGAPMVVGETYNLLVRFYDKNKHENEIISKVDLLVKE
ncbi:MAG TPA: hypothetical protein VL946_03465 [Lacibacter sp.]|jgi:hypothetical protein|nr:hypothetical protein [Lacibacter sp.]